MLDYIELTTLVITVIGLGIVIIKTLSKLIRATEKQTTQTEIQTAQFKSFASSCKEKLADIEEDIDKLSGYAVDHEKRIYGIEEWKKQQEVK